MHPTETPTDFQNFNLPISILKAVAALNFTKPTPIQEQGIPLIIEGKDLIGCAQTGTGKTGAFSIPLLARLLTQGQGTLLILAPTRELVLQIDLFWRSLLQFTPGVYSATIIGGAAMQNQMRMLRRNPRILIATPGRLLDHLDRRTVTLSSCNALVLDEADRMLDMGFAPQLTQILRHVPAQRQTLMFTATWSPEVDQLAQRYLKTPSRVTIGRTSQAAPKITQKLVQTSSQGKNETLLDELNQSDGSVLVFARTKSRTDRVAKYLSSFGLAVGRIHGGRTQGQRNTALSAFRSGEIRILVATDIAARGIDVKEISHVINYDLPQTAEDYIHRIGRTGRAGATGAAVSLVTPEDRSQWSQISRLLRNSGSKIPVPMSPLAQ